MGRVLNRGGLDRRWVWGMLNLRCFLDLQVEVAGKQSRTWVQVESWVELEIKI